MLIKSILLVILSICLAGCARLSLAMVNAPAAFSSSEVTRNVFFGPAPAQKLDIYNPRQADDPPLDVVVFFYGGSWQSGNKEDYKFAAHALASRGFVVVIPDYRKYPAVKFPTFMDDAAASIAWVSNNISDYGGNPTRIHVAGHSAGAHIGALVTADERYLVPYAIDKHRKIKSFAGLAGPYDFTPQAPEIRAIFGPPDNYPNMQVSNFINGDEPPMMLMHGALDTTVNISNLERLRAKILEKQGSVQTRIYEGVDHMWIVGAFSWLGANKPDVASDMAAFFRSVE
jgi:acetyl esterase/lipase